MIAIGETIIIHAGRTAVLPNIQIDGTLTVDGTVFIPSGATTTDIDTKLSTKVDKVISTDNAVVRFDGITGAVQNSSVIVDDSGNVGIGTSSPDFSLEVVGNDTTVKISNNNTGPTTTALQIGGYSGVSSGLYGTTLRSIHNFGVSAESSLAFELGGSELMRITSAGNVGIGVTPSAWGSTGNITANSIGSSTVQCLVGANAYYNLGYKYASTGIASQYEQDNGNHNWKIAPSGTAGNAITWTNAMTLSSSGNLLVGTTTDNGVDKLQVNGSISSGAIQKYISGDLNNFKYITQTIGTYPSAYMSNTPINDHGYLEIIVYSANTYVMQRFTTLGALQTAGRVFVRCLHNGTWTAWVEK